MTRRAESGYTLIEMLVAISVSTLLILAIGNYASAGIIGSNQDYNRTLVLSNAKDAVNIVARQVLLARAVEGSNSLADNYAPNAPTDLYSWSGAAGSGTSLILEVPSRDTGGSIVYYNGSDTAVYTDEVVFYLDATTRKLYKRVIANPNLPVGVTNGAKTTCPPAHASAGCPADADVVDDVANLVTKYIAADGTVCSSSCSPAGTEAVNYTVTETRTINGKSYTGTYTSVATMRNKF
jgi:prepilin-type N-terminal cleavage/methylation domain-containing protein